MSDALDRLLATGAGDTRPLLGFAARRWSRAQLLAEARGFAAELARRGLPPGACLGIALPNFPATVVALLAALLGGYRALPVDPRQPVDALLDWQARLRPDALVTQDLATVFERTRPLLADPALTLVAVARLADELAPLPRLLTPWLRAGGTVRHLADPRAFFWIRRAGVAEPAEPQPLLLPDGAVLSREALAAAAPRGGMALLALPLAAPAALAALFGAWAGDATLLLSPRLDAKGLAKAAKQSGVTERIE